MRSVRADISQFGYGGSSGSSSNMEVFENGTKQVGVWVNGHKIMRTTVTLFLKDSEVKPFIESDKIELLLRNGLCITRNDGETDLCTSTAYSVPILFNNKSGFSNGITLLGDQNGIVNGFIDYVVSD